MPALPTERTLRRLARFRSARSGVLSLYANFDPADGARRDVTAVALNALHALSRSPLEQRFGGRIAEEREALDAFLRRDFQLVGRSLIVFSCRPQGLWETFQLHVPVRPLVRFAERPVVSPLAAVLDEHERYAVVLLDKEQARLIEVYLGQIERRLNVYDEYPGRTAMGGWTQARYERHRDVHLHRHVLHVAEALQKEARRSPFDRLVVGGPDEARSAFLNVLPKGLRSRVVGTFSAELFALDDDVLDRVRAIEEAAERGGEQRLVADVIDAAGGGGLAALGWDETLQALGEGRVHKLVLAEGRSRRGYACPARDFAALGAAKTCPICGAPLERVPDLAEWAVETAIDTDAAVETVAGPAAKTLAARGGAAAVLRY